MNLAFDDSPATRWRSWAPATPGMFIETEFDVDRAIDEVRVITADADRYHVKMQIDGIDARKEEVDLQVPTDIRRTATAQLRANQVNYILIRDDGYGAEDFSKDPAAWGLTVAARTPLATIYKVNP